MNTKHLKSTLTWVAANELSLLEARVLLILHDEPSPIPIGRVATAAGFSTAAMTGTADRLEKRGLLQRSHSPEDRRTVLVGLTTKGRGLFSSTNTTR